MLNDHREFWIEEISVVELFRILKQTDVWDNSFDVAEFLHNSERGTSTANVESLGPSENYMIVTFFSAPEKKTSFSDGKLKFSRKAGVASCVRFQCSPCESETQGDRGVFQSAAINCLPAC